MERNDSLLLLISHVLVLVVNVKLNQSFSHLTIRVSRTRTQISCEFCNMLRSWRWDQGKDLFPLLYIWFKLMYHFHSSQNSYQAKQLQCKNPVSSIRRREGSWLISLKLNFPQGLFFIARNHRPSVSACRDTAPGGDIKLPLLCQQIFEIYRFRIDV